MFQCWKGRGPCLRHRGAGQPWRLRGCDRSMGHLRTFGRLRMRSGTAAALVYTFSGANSRQLIPHFHRQMFTAWNSLWRLRSDPPGAEDRTERREGCGRCLRADTTELQGGNNLVYLLSHNKRNRLNHILNGHPPSLAVSRSAVRHVYPISADIRILLSSDSFHATQRSLFISHGRLTLSTTYDLIFKC